LLDWLVSKMTTVKHCVLQKIIWQNINSKTIWIFLSL
jgi:hypothetical protein